MATLAANAEKDPLEDLIDNIFTNEKAREFWEDGEAPQEADPHEGMDNVPIDHDEHEKLDDEQIGSWNLARWLESLIPLMEQPEVLESVLDHYGEVFNEHHNQMWVAKLGLDSWRESDQLLIQELNTVLQIIETDMTIFFRLYVMLSTRNTAIFQKPFTAIQMKPKSNGICGSTNGGIVSKRCQTVRS